MSSGTPEFYYIDTSALSEISNSPSLHHPLTAPSIAVGGDAFLCK